MARSSDLPPTILPEGWKPPFETHQDSAAWDEYLKPRSDMFTQLFAQSHYMLAIGYIFQRDPKPVSVADLGCGYGGFYDLLQYQKTRMKRYLGVDISPWGIEQAQKKYPGVDFQVGDLYDWTPKDNEKFDRIVIADSLQCLDGPMDILKRLIPFLAEEGRIIVSTFDTTHRSMEDFWSGSETHFTVEDACTVRNETHQRTWHVRMIRPR